MANQSYYEDELSLLDICNVLKAYWRSIVFTPFVFALVAFVATWPFVTPKYEVQGMIDIGRVNQALLETPDTMVDRLNHPAFINRVVEEHANLFLNKKEVGQKNDLKSFLAKRNKDSDAVSFRFISSDPERAKLEAVAVMQTLTGIHQKLFKDNIELVKQQVTLIDRQIEVLKTDQIPNDEFSKDVYDSFLKAFIVNHHKNQFSNLLNRKLELEAGLNSTMSYNTRLLENIYVSEEPVSPNLPIVTLVAFLLGLLGAVFAAFVRNALKA